MGLGNSANILPIRLPKPPAFGSRPQQILLRACTGSGTPRHIVGWTQVTPVPLQKPRFAKGSWPLQRRRPMAPDSGVAMWLESAKCSRFATVCQCSWADIRTPASSLSWLFASLGVTCAGEPLRMCRELRRLGLGLLRSKNVCFYEPFVMDCRWRSLVSIAADNNRNFEY